MTEITRDATGIVSKAGRCSLSFFLSHNLVNSRFSAITPQATNYSHQTPHTFQLAGESIGKWLFVLVLFSVVTALGTK